MRPAPMPRKSVAAEFDGTGDAGVLRKVMGDLAAKGIAITEDEIRAKMDELMAGRSCR